MRSYTRGKTDFLLRYSKLSIILIYNLGSILGAAIFYPLIPVLMGYPKEIMELNGKVGVSYDLQYIILAVVMIIIGTLLMFLLLRGIGKWKTNLKNGQWEQLRSVREKCINIPYTVFIIQVALIGVFVSAVVGFVCFINRTPFSQFLKISTVVFSLFSLAAVFSHIFCKRLFTKILLKTYKGEGLQGKRIGIRKKIFLQILPMFIVATLFLTVLAYSRIMEEKGDLAYTICKLQLSEALRSESNFQSTSELFGVLEKIKIEKTTIGYFAVDRSNGEIITSDSYIPGSFFKYFVINPVRGDRVYGDSYDTQGVVASVKINGEDYFAGIRFENASDTTIGFFLVAFFVLLALNIFVLYYFSKSLSDEISLVAGSLSEIAEGEHVDLDRKIAVTSNDELGDLIIAFNKIQDKEKEYIKEKEEQQAIMIERERLASLGQLVGGIAHNMKTPIMSISGGLEAIKDLINEYRESVDDINVFKEDHYEIAQEMLQWTEKIKPHCAYMSDIISAVKGQAVQLNYSSAGNFTLDELVKKIQVLMKHELKINYCIMKLDIQIPGDTELAGEINSLVQAINNIILNAIHSYEGREGKIEFAIEEKSNNVLFSIKDNGKGIPASIKNRLFKEMVTTKGKNGTGLGLYMSFSTIKGHFGGNMWFESEENKGTTFYITIPKIKVDIHQGA